MTPSATESVSLVAARATQVHPSLRGADADRNLAVRIVGLNHTYGQGETSTQVLFDNNLQLARGEIVIMTGRSGSGKTTLLTLIGGLRTTQEGSCQVLGQELLGMSSRDLVALRRQIGFIFQAHNLFGSLTAVQNVRMALELHRRDCRPNRAAAEEILNAVGLGHRLKYKPDELSGGQRQRVAIARALVNRPKLILADEPTAALDEESSKLVVDLLKKLAREEQATILIVTHDNRILSAADRIVNMSGGRIVSNVLVQESAEICKFLHECPLFAPITPSNLTQIADKMDLEAYAAGSPIVRQGDAGDKFYVIRRGSVKIETARDGVTRQLATLTSGGFFGEAALVTGEPRNATVTALDDVECYTLDKQEFEQVMKSSLEFADELRKVLFERQ